MKPRLAPDIAAGGLGNVLPENFEVCIRYRIEGTRSEFKSSME